ncbi:MAG: hypothetical protein IKO55_16500 [Kiritimatiellae bacterium]|nr:hypothetical protein [Kiritimatiellia bacterium]
MKNTIPLVIAVMLGLAAVFAVSRTIARNRGDEVQKISVLVANKNLSAGEEIRNDDISFMAIPREAYMSSQHVRAENSNWVVGQKLQRSVASGAFVLIDDVVSQGRGLASEIADGEWCVPVHFADSTLVESIQPGDDIAIIMIVQDAMATGRTDDEGEAEYVKVQTSRVLFPSVGVLRKTPDGILVSLNPQEAQRLLMAQLNAPLYPMLRKPDDSTHRSVQPGRGVTTLSLSEQALVDRDAGQGNF